LFPATRLLEFVVGILMARIVMSGTRIRIRPWHAWLALGACCVAAVGLPILYQVAAATVIPLAFLIPATAQHDLDGRSAFLASRPMIWLGNISFAVYLVHGLVFLHVARAFGADFAWTLPTAVLAIAIAVTASILLSWLLFKGVELPVQRRFSVKRVRTSPQVGG
ncbi:acyltransferase family protein, partial [Nocardia gipuzkoensis]